MSWPRHSVPTLACRRLLLASQLTQCLAQAAMGSVSLPERTTIRETDVSHQRIMGTREKAEESWRVETESGVGEVAPDACWVTLWTGQPCSEDASTHLPTSPREEPRSREVRCLGQGHAATGRVGTRTQGSEHPSAASRPLPHLPPPSASFPRPPPLPWVLLSLVSSRELPH